ncbi:putative transposase [Cricetulus griseus]|nr:putative transposase [Cricetulus griseus]
MCGPDPTLIHRIVNYSCHEREMAKIPSRNSQDQLNDTSIHEKRTDIRVLELFASTRRELWSHNHQENKKHLLHPPEERMRRGQGKSTSNNRKHNMTPPETRNHTPVRPQHHDVDEPEENKLKNIFRKMIEDLKEDMRKSLKEIEDKTNQKIQEIVQELKSEIDTIKKAQSEFLSGGPLHCGIVCGFALLFLFGFGKVELSIAYVFVGKVFFYDFVEYVLCTFELGFFTFFYTCYP